VACEELLVELQADQGKFSQRDAQLVVLGSRPESVEVAKQSANQRGITYTLLRDAETNVTKKLGLWSDHMDMPWMGYLVIDKSGRVAASELQLSEAKGAAPETVAAILGALDRSRQAETAEPSAGG